MGFFTNECYLIAWCHLQHSMGTGLSDEFVHGGLSTAMRILCKRALQGWRNVHAQQDASEVATFALNFVRPDSYNSRWEARREVLVPDLHSRISGLRYMLLSNRHRPNWSLTATLYVFLVYSGKCSCSGQGVPAAVSSVEEVSRKSYS